MTLTRSSFHRCNECPGFVSHGWRTSCVKCRCPRTSHEIGTRNWVLGFERLGLEPLPSHAAGGGGGSGPQGPAPLKHFAPMVLEGYAWSPPVSTSAFISREKRFSASLCE